MFSWWGRGEAGASNKQKLRREVSSLQSDKLPVLTWEVEYNVCMGIWVTFF